MMPGRSYMFAAAVVGLLLAAGGTRVVAQDDEAGQLPHIYFIWQEVVVLQACNEIGLTSAQAAEAASAIAPAFAQLRQIWEQENSRQMREALTRLRDELVRGGPVAVEMWIEVARARGMPGVEEGEEDPIERRKAELAHDVGVALLGVLSDRQIAHLGGTTAEAIVEEIAAELDSARARAPEQWRSFKADAIARVSAGLRDMGREPDADLGEQLEGYFDRARAMDTDTYFAQREELVAELITLTGADHATGPEVVRMRALNKLSEWAETRRLPELFGEMAAAYRQVAGPD